jgi:energy-coupling factor transporter ATP-binding protein EcfA2
MEDVKIYEIRVGIGNDSLYQLSKDKKHLFCYSKRLGIYTEEDKFYCMDPSFGKTIFFAEARGEKISTRYNQGLGKWEFKDDDCWYRIKMPGTIQKLHILDQKPIPPGWKWTKRLGHSQICYLWHEQIDKIPTRLERVSDLQLIFKRGAAFDNLEKCREQLLLCAGNAAVATDKTSAGEMPLACSAQNVIDFNHKYRHILMAIKTQPFILLAGISGIGKSRLVRILAYLTCIEKKLQHPDRPGNFELIKVKPDWHDSSELIGYPTRRSGTLKYNITAFLRFLVKAWHYVDVPFWICLDEMNLARVEQYFAEYLSIIETRRFHEGQIHSDDFISKEDILSYSKEDPDFWLNLGVENNEALQQQFLLSGITMPPNLIVMGTVNMDETTHAFSRKVLDRAMTIEMNEMDMERGLCQYKNEWQYPENFITAGFLTGRLQDVGAAYNMNLSTGRKVIGELKEIYDILSDSPFRFGYRARDEILMYCAYNSELVKQKKLENWLNRCLDEMIMMKILSRIEGNERKCGTIIRLLLEKMHNKFPKSYEKLGQMQRRLENSGYTSYWY